MSFTAHHGQVTSLGVDDLAHERLASTAAGTGAAALGDVGTARGAVSHAGSNLPVGNAETVADDHEQVCANASLLKMIVKVVF